MSQWREALWEEGMIKLFFSHLQTFSQVLLTRDSALLMQINWLSISICFQNQYNTQNTIELNTHTHIHVVSYSYIVFFLDRKCYRVKNRACSYRLLFLHAGGSDRISQLLAAAAWWNCSLCPCSFLVFSLKHECRVHLSCALFPWQQTGEFSFPHIFTWSERLQCCSEL